MKNFLSCDWGTTSFRLRVIETSSSTIIAEENSDQGIALTFELWKKTGQSEERRLPFYLNILQICTTKLEKKLNTSLNGMPLVISGMASSSIGLIELPYKEVPFAADGADLITKNIEADNEFPHYTIIVSGAKTDDDAMRGEETMLAGCFSNNFSGEEQVYIFPGTHSKHVVVKNGKAITIKTFMSGEFFELLSKKSILSASVEEENDLLKNIRPFQDGVSDSAGNLLNSCFHIRTNDLFGKLTKQQNYYYLSGLLIGSEMRELMQANYSNIVLVSNETITAYYETAFEVLNKKNQAGVGLIFKIQNADEMLIHGQLKILREGSNK